MRIHPLPGLALFLLSSTPLAGEVHVVDLFAGPGFEYTSIQAAVTAAAPGDTVLVRSGSYGSFTVQGKGLVVTADAGAFVQVSRIFVRDVPAGQAVRLGGLQTWDQDNGPGLTVEDCLGPVWIEDCQLAGALLSSAGIWSRGADVQDSSAVTFHRCTIAGSFAIYVQGGAGLRVRNSLLALFDCDVAGGQGGSDMSGFTLLAGPAAELEGGTLYASGTTFSGGAGGTGSIGIGCEDAGDGGPGLLIDGGAQAHLLGSEASGGPGGVSPSTCADGLAGPRFLVLGGGVLEQAFPARSLRATNPVREGGTLTFTLDGLAGDLAFLWLSPVQNPFYLGPLGGPLPLAGGVFLTDPSSLPLALGVVPPGGLQLGFTVRGVGLHAVELYAQALLISEPEAGGVVTSSGQGITILAAGP